MKKKKWYRVMAAVLAAIVLFSGFMVIRELLTKQKEKKEFDELAELVITEEDSDKIHLPVKLLEEKKRRNLSKLFAKNGDCIGWLCIPDTAVNYPVMHTPDEPQKYLRKNFYGSYSFSGVPFLDARCTLESDNLILYSHNMRNGTMFAGLRGYREQAFCKSHPVIEFETAEECGYYSVFAVMTGNTDNSWYRFIDTETPEEYEKYIEKAKAASLYETGITPEYGEQILTLSTCTGLARDNRLLVLAGTKWASPPQPPYPPILGDWLARFAAPSAVALATYFLLRECA